MAVIKVQNLSKRFIIQHENGGVGKYTALRDVIANRVKGLGRKKDKEFVKQEEFWALKDVSFEINQGDRVGIIGRNGAGKSTLLKVLSRITEPTSGSVKIKGRVASLLEVGTGFHPELTGRENIFLNGAILGMSRSEIRAKFDEIVAFAEVEKFLDTPVKRYSSGMYVRLAFAVAAHLEPEILVVDEVLAVGDAEFQKKCLGKMKDVSVNEGRTVLFVSHNMGLICSLCEQGLLLKNGSLSFYGKATQIVEKYLVDEKSISSYSIEKHPNGSSYFTSVSIGNISGLMSSDFSFSDSIAIKFCFVVDIKIPGLQIGIGLNDKFNNRVFTVIKEINFFEITNGIGSGKVLLPEGIIAPNNYTITIALWTKNGEIYDLVEGLAVKIHDNGTDLALYEGIDYGSILVKVDWYEN